MVGATSADQASSSKPSLPDVSGSWPPEANRWHFPQVDGSPPGAICGRLRERQLSHR